MQVEIWPHSYFVAAHCYRGMRWALLGDWNGLFMLLHKVLWRRLTGWAGCLCLLSTTSFVSTSHCCNSCHVWCITGLSRQCIGNPNTPRIHLLMLWQVAYLFVVQRAIKVDRWTEVHTYLFPLGTPTRCFPEDKSFSNSQSNKKQSRNIYKTEPLAFKTCI